MKTIVLALMRHALTAVGGYLFQKGLVDQSEQEQLVSAILVLVGIGWSIYTKIRSKEAKAAAIVPLLVCGLALSMTGCLNMLATQSHNHRVAQAQALRIQAKGNGEIFAGVDFLAVPGWIGAWKEEPGLMSVATRGDILAGLGTYYLYQKSTEGDDNSAINVNGDNNRVAVGGRDATVADTTLTSAEETRVNRTSTSTSTTTAEK